MPNGFDTRLLTLAAQALIFRACGAVFWCFTPDALCSGVSHQMRCVLVFHTRCAVFWCFTADVLCSGVSQQMCWSARQVSVSGWKVAGCSRITALVDQLLTPLFLFSPA